VDDTVVMRVDAGLEEVGVDEVAGGVAVFEVTFELEPLTADLEAVGHVPVVVDGGRRVVRRGDGLAGVDDGGDSEDDDRHDRDREDGSALHAEAAAAGTVREFRCLAGRG
jgi:hypothetical protein